MSHLYNTLKVLVNKFYASLFVDICLSIWVFKDTYTNVILKAFAKYGII